MSGFSDNEGISHYIIYLGKTRIGTTTGTSFTYKSASNLDGTLTFNVKAVDAAGNAGKTVSTSITASSATPLNKTIGGIDNLTFEECWNDEFENCQCGGDWKAHYKNCMPAAAKYGSIKGTAGADTITFAANKSRLIGNISLGDGNDKIVHLDSAADNEDDSTTDGYLLEGSVYFNFGNGDDTLALGKYNSLELDTINMGSGTDTLTMGTKSDLYCSELSFGAGNDTLSIAGGEYEGGEIHFGAGSDKLSVHAESEVYIDNLIDFDDGNDTLGIAAGGVVYARTLDFGAGTDTLKLNGTLNIGLSAGLPCIKGLENLSGTGTLGIDARGDSIDKSGIMNFVKGTDINVVNTLGKYGFRGYIDEQCDNKISGSSVLTLRDTTDEADFWLCGKNFAANVDFGLADAVDYIKLDKTSAISELEIGASGNYGSDWTFAVLDASGNTLSGSKYALMTDGSNYDYTVDISSWSNGTYYLKFQVAANSALNGWIEIDNMD